jgi:hypothetical protein
MVVGRFGSVHQGEEGLAARGVELAQRHDVHDGQRNPVP